LPTGFWGKWAARIGINRNHLECQRFFPHIERSAETVSAPAILRRFSVKIFQHQSSVLG
jgi:hypothetical protein